MQLVCSTFFTSDGRMNTQPVVFTVMLGFLVFVLYPTQGQSIGCFVCSSINGSEPDCEDTFNNTGKFYNPNCYAIRKNRYGMFPGTECIKLKGTMSGTGETIVVRTCVVDNGDVNSETEIGRSNHCGLINYIKYDSRNMYGCLLSCDTDGCNSAPSHKHISHGTILTSLLCLTVCKMLLHFI